MADSLMNDKVGSIAYQLIVDDVVVDEVPAEQPIEYLHGYDNLVPGLEQALEGKGAGDEFEVTLQPEDGFGEYDEDDRDEVSIEDFAGFDTIEAGMEVELIDELGDFFEAVIHEVREDTVILDFNPPFAGKVLTYRVIVGGVREATEEELQMGIPVSLAEELFDLGNEDE